MIRLGEFEIGEVRVQDIVVNNFLCPISFSGASFSDDCPNTEREEGKRAQERKNKAGGISGHFGENDKVDLGFGIAIFQSPDKSPQLLTTPFCALSARSRQDETRG